jgi:hypothetical protein
MITERYRQFETAYSNFKGRHSAHRSMHSGASFSFNKTTNNDTDTNVAPWTPADNQGRIPPPSRLANFTNGASIKITGNKFSSTTRHPFTPISPRQASSIPSQKKKSSRL